MSSIFLAVACGSSGSDAVSSDSPTVGAGGAGGTVSLDAGGGGNSSGGRAGAAATGAGGSGAHAGTAAAGGAGPAVGGSTGANGGSGGGALCPPTQGGHTPTCAMSSGDDCAACVCGAPDCTEKWNACVADDACARALGCVLASCATTLCAAIAGDGQTKLVALLGCLTGSCATVCKVGHAAGAGGAGHAGAGGGSSGGQAGKSGGAGGAGGGGGAGTGGGGLGAGGSGASGEGGQGGGGTTGTGGAGGASVACDSTSCDHDLCANGSPLGSACSACASVVCQKDGYCCDAHGYWDDLCVARAADLCTCDCGAAGAGGSGGTGAGGSAPVVACQTPPETPSAGACAMVDPKGPVECNPVTGAPCDVGSGAVCDASFVGGTLAGFHCYGGTNDQPLCSPCGVTDGFCALGLTCTTQGCAKLCCDAADCGSNATCDQEVGGFGIGVCVEG